MSLVSRVAALSSKAWGQFKSGFPSLTGNYLYLWGNNATSQLGQYMAGTTVARSSPVQIGARTWSTSLAVASSSSSVMAIDSSGQLWGWGNGAAGILGNGSTIDRSSPVQVGTLTNWVQVSVGTTAAAAVKNDGTLWTWGAGTSGQLGDGTAVTKSSPVQVGTLTTNWSSVSCGTTFMLATRTDGTLWAWGLQTGGRLGNGTTTATGLSSPVQIGTLTNWTSIACGALNGFGIAGGKLYSWGTAGAIQGSGSTVATSVPTQIGTLTAWSKVSAGDNQAGAIKSDNTLWTWGTSANGALGDGTTVAKSSPVQVGTLTTNWSSVAIGTNAMSALRSDGTLWGWGTNNSGQLGVNTLTNYSSPVQVGTLTSWTAAAAAGNVAVFRGPSNYIFTTGAATSGQLGQTTPANSSPVAVGLGTSKYASVALGGSYSMAVRTDRTLWGWGANNLGQLGNGTTNAIADYPSNPVQIGALANWNAVQAGLNGTTFATDTTGKIYSWGDNTAGSLGQGVFDTPPASAAVPMQYGNIQFSQMTSGDQYSLMITPGGALYATGLNTYGRLGLASSASSPVQVGTLTNWKQVACASTTSIAVKTDGTLWAWGYGSNGALGNNTSALTNSSPVQIGTLTTWSSVYVNSNLNTAYAVKNDGTIWSWGDNTYGQLGTGSTTSAPTYPQQYGNIGGYTNVSMGTTGGLLRKSDGTLWSWGPNTQGQNGNGTLGATSSPQQVGTLTTWSKISAGDFHSLGIKSDGTLWSWGRGFEGQLGVGGIQGNSVAGAYSSPVQIAYGHYSSLASGVGNNGGASGALDVYGQIWTWGTGGNGQIGNNNTANQSFPIQIGTLTWGQLSIGVTASLARKTDGTLWAWGYNGLGQLGDGTTTDQSSPIQIGTLTNWSTVYNGYGFSFGIKTDNTLWSWGYNNLGQLGTSDTTNYSSPVQIAGTTWSSIASGTSFSVAIKTDGTLWSWGGNTYGQLGSGTTNNRSSPVQVGTLTNWSKVYASSDTFLAVKTDGTLWGCGRNNAPFIASNPLSQYSSPVQIGTLTNWSSIGMGANHVWARKTDSTLWAWGVNAYGQLGDGTTTDRSSPIQVGSLTNWVSTRGSQDGSFALNSNGDIFTCGNNNNGTGYFYFLGAYAPTTSYLPAQVGSDTTWSSVSGGSSYTMALKTNGTLWAWGSNETAQLGNGGGGTGVFVMSPIQIGTLTTWKSVGAAQYTTYAIKTDNSFWAWGYGAQGQLGDGTTTQKSSPVQIGTLTNWSSIGVGCASDSIVTIKTDGTAWGWGRNLSDQLGVANTTAYSSPVQIGTLTNRSIAQSNGFGGNGNSMLVNSSGQAWGAGSAIINGGGNNTLSPLAAIDTYSATSLAIDGNSDAALLNQSTGYPYVWGIGTYNYIQVSNISSPVQIGTLTTWSTNAVQTNGTLWTWGDNTYGQLGQGDTYNRAAPQKVGTLTNWSKVLDNNLTAYGLKTDGTIWSWGYNPQGQIGDGTTVNKSSPVQIGTLTTWIDINSNTVDGFAVQSNNTLWAWGPNGNGTLGDNTTTNRSSPVQIGGYNGYTKVFSAYLGGYAITGLNIPYGWGSTVNYSQTTTLFNPGTLSTSSPVQIGGTTGVSSINAGNTVGAFIKGGQLWMWGYNGTAQLGTGDTINRPGPNRVGSLSTWASVSVGNSHTLATKTDGTLWAWGLGTTGQLGQGSTTSYSSPVQVGTLTTWASVATVLGSAYSAAVKTDGTLWVWGRNTEGQLGQVNATNYSSPVQVGTLTNWAAVSCDQYTTIATKTDGTLWAWGQNTVGQVGDGTSTVRSSPVQIGTLTTWVKPVGGETGTNSGALRSS
jgi:alpha-tubulin suppressor-like RCC1 family protein